MDLPSNTSETGRFLEGKPLETTRLVRRASFAVQQLFGPNTASVVMQDILCDGREDHIKEKEVLKMKRIA